MQRLLRLVLAWEREDDWYLITVAFKVLGIHRKMFVNCALFVIHVNCPLGVFFMSFMALSGQDIVC